MFFFLNRTTKITYLPISSLSLSLSLDHHHRGHRPSLFLSSSLSLLYFFSPKYIFNLAPLFIIVIFVEVDLPLLIITTRKVPFLPPSIVPFARSNNNSYAEPLDSTGRNHDPLKKLFIFPWIWYFNICLIDLEKLAPQRQQRHMDGQMQQNNAAATIAPYDHPGGGSLRNEGPGSDAGDAVLARWLQFVGFAAFGLTFGIYQN
ncbi:unnamed protein product [Camellia sinensis]